MPLTSRAFCWRDTCLILAPGCCSCPSWKILPRCLPPSPLLPYCRYKPYLLRQASPRMLPKPAMEAQPTHAAAMLLSLPCPHLPRTLWAGPLLVCVGCLQARTEPGIWHASASVQGTQLNTKDSSSWENRDPTRYGQVATKYTIQSS